MTEAERKNNAREAYNALMKWYPFTLEDLDGEQWRDIEGYEGRYQVSNYGRVKSFKRKNAKILKPLFQPSGYMFICFSEKNNVQRFYIHILVARSFLSNPEHKPEVNHIDGHTFNCCTDNLEWVTPSENAIHAFKIGLRKLNEEHANAKLTNEQVKQIRENTGHLTISQLAEKFGINNSTIERAQLGKTYKDVAGSIRDKLPSGRSRVTDDIRNEIRRLYVKGDLVFGSRAQWH